MDSDLVTAIDSDRLLLVDPYMVAVTVISSD